MQKLVSTEWLAGELGSDDLIVFDTTVLLRGGDGASVSIEPDRAGWERGHIPGSGFLDIVEELSDPDSSLWFTVPPIQDLVAAFEARGIGDGTKVVLYDSRFNMWATRVWWMLRSIGFDDAAVLDGGWGAWTSDGREQSTSPEASRRPGVLGGKPRQGLFVGSDRVVAAIEGTSTCVLNALSHDNHDGTDASYGKPGHIPGASNVPAMGMVDPETHRYRPLEELREDFTGTGAFGEPVIAYCGGGIAATSDAFVLTLLGHQNVSVYDGSLRDWINKGLPLEV